MNFCSFFPPELYEIFLSRAKERWKSFSETNSENDVEGVIFFVVVNKNFSKSSCWDTSVIFTVYQELVILHIHYLL